MIRYPRERKQFDGLALESFAQDAQKRFVLLVVVKDRQSCISNMEGMVHRTAVISTPFSGHDGYRSNGVFRNPKQNRIADRPSP
jgi:hypothetical protein